MWSSHLIQEWVEKPRMYLCFLFWFLVELIFSEETHFLDTDKNTYIDKIIGIKWFFNLIVLAYRVMGLIMMFS